MPDRPEGSDPIAEDRPPAEACERGTEGCCVRHLTDSECEPW